MNRATISDIKQYENMDVLSGAKKWGMNTLDCMSLFEENRLFDYINDGYEYLHLMSYKNVVNELEDVIKISNDKLKEYGAVTLLQRTLEKYARQKNITIEAALRIFSESPLYDGLFDYEGTQLWKEGPDYLISLLNDMY